mmetsp:Transcript_3517/g.3062  ORF Transcript_3517/g.3062 Transcript_3517/m.3062 type:complete len:100 (-) Transcript_3517:782-1081(-)
MIDFGYDLILTSGLNGKIEEFVKYLYDVESKEKRALYPKFWDFYEVNQFSMFNVKQGAEEWNMVVNSFMKTMNGSQVQKVERIQNRYLMDAYINMISKR